jgi:hypothetical protein
MGREGGVMRGGKIALSAAFAVCLLSPALAEPVAGKLPKKITVHPRRLWHGYGFLPGYRPQANDLDWRGRNVRYVPAYEWRYLNLYTGQWSYGWGRPGFYRGRWNGGSFGPCWTQTPIGPMWNCGR